MKVLFVTNWYPKPDDPHNGIFVREHARAIAQAGHEVCVVSLDISDGGLLSRTTKRVTDEYGFETHVVGIHSKFYKKLYGAFPVLQRIFIRYIKRHVLPGFSPDVVHSNVIYIGGIMGHTLARQLNVPHIITEHWSKIDHMMKHNLLAQKARAAYEQADAITCVSEYLASVVRKYVSDQAKVRIIPNVVRSDIFRYEQPATPQELTFTAAASWNPPKRPDLLVGALNSIALKSNREFVLHMFGVGSQLEEIRQLKLAPNFRITYPGFCSKDVIAAQLYRSHFFLHASEIETFSLVVAEALCCGTPVVASDRGAIPELVQSDCGLLCDNTPEDWKAKLEHALTLTFDRTAISSRYRGRFGYEAIGRQFTALYDHCVKGTEK